MKHEPSLTDYYHLVATLKHLEKSDSPKSAPFYRNNVFIIKRIALLLRSKTVSI